MGGRLANGRWACLWVVSLFVSGGFVYLWWACLFVVILFMGSVKMLCVMNLFIGCGLVYGW